MVRALAAERVNLTAAQAEIERFRLTVQKLQRSHARSEDTQKLNQRRRCSFRLLKTICQAG